jgi:hypothetical protein
MRLEELANNVKNPPLYLHVTSLTKEGLEGAAKIIADEMNKDLPELVDERRFKRPPREENQVERDSRGRVCAAADTRCHEVSTFVKY